ncbi:MAG: redoxin domain-containing protein [Lachnospiraceae bacterium]|nr:redoxin domain-containing protein [Lachnospiraceae bacterium]
MQTLTNQISYIALFTEGLLSFFSPCVFPLIPLYLGYLAGSNSNNTDGKSRKTFKKLINSILFILGICITFYGLGYAATFISKYKSIILPIGGIFVLIYGIYQLDIFGKVLVLEKEYRLPFNLSKVQSSPIMALLLGITFSFAWTPCVGPMLASALLVVAGTADSLAESFLMITAYSLGFIIPFIIISILDTTLLVFLKKHNKFLNVTKKLGAIILIIIGLLMITGLTDDINRYYLSLTPKAESETINVENETAVDESETINDASWITENNSDAIENNSDAIENNSDAIENNSDAIENNSDVIENNSDVIENNEVEQLKWNESIPDFTLIDQFGNEHTLSDYLGKTIILNFWATWCPPCRAEMPEFEKLYSENIDDTVILGVVIPTDESDNITEFMSINGYNYTTLIDYDETVTYTYGIMAFPTTFIISKDCEIVDVIIGMTNYDTLKSYVE